jgi:PAS domain S-box-containing protein
MAGTRFIVRHPGTGFAITVLLMAAVAAVGALSLDRVSADHQNRVARAAEDLVVAEQLRANLHARTLPVQTMMLTSQRVPREDLWHRTREFDQLLGELRGRARSETRRELVEQLAQRELELRELGSRALDLVDGGQQEEARQLYLQQILPARVEVDNLAAALLQSALERMQETEQELGQRARAALWLLVAVATTALGAAGLTALLYSRGLRRQHDRQVTAAEANERHRRQLHAVLSSSLDHIYLLDRDLVVQFASAAALRGVGRNTQELVGRRLSDAGILGEPTAEVVEHVHQVLVTGAPFRSQAFLPTMSGYACFDYELSPVRDDGRVEAVVLSARDVTERWRNEEALRDWSTRVVTILESITDAFVAIDRDWRYTYANHEAERLFGLPRSRIEGRMMWELLPELVDSPVEAVFRRSLEQGERADLEEYVQALGRWLEIHLFPSPMGLSVYFRDITGRKRVESHQRLLSASGAVLGSSLELEEVAQRLTRVTLAGLADLAVFWPGERLASVPPQVAHATEAQEPLLREAVATGAVWPGGSEDDEAPALIDEVRAEHLDAWASDLTHRRRLAALEMGSVLRVPLVAASQRLGVLVLARHRGQPAFDDRDVILARDFGSRAAMALKSALLYGAAQKAIHSREEVLAVVSHDLRNPISSLRLTAQQLERSPDEQLDPVRVRRLAHRMHQAAERASRLIRDLLDLAAAQAGALRLERQPHLAVEIARAAAELLQPMTEEKGLEVKVLGDADAWVECDRERVLQILSNLLGNALRFSPPGVPLIVQVLRMNGTVRFCVRDRGPGIAPEQRTKIFERFWQQGARTGGSAGLGLSIVKTLVEAHGGTVGVESEPGRGSTFYFTLPRVDPPPVAPPSPQLPLH